MKAALRRWARRSLWILPIALVFYVIVMGLDLAWYRAHVPMRFRGANWEGRWETRRFWGIHGRLLVLMPDPLPDGVDFKAEAVVYCPIYSPWRTGQFIPMDFTGHLGADSRPSGGRTSNAIPASNLLMKFKGSAGNQQVEYAALIDESRTTIVGGYLSRGPYDFGHFEIARY